MENKDKIVTLSKIFGDLVADEGYSIGDVLNCHQILVLSALEQVVPKERRHRVLMDFIRNRIQISLVNHIDEVTPQEK